MRVLFISKGFRYLGIEYLSAVLKAHGHEAWAINNPGYFEGDARQVGDVLRRLDPDLIAMSVDSINSSWYFTLAEKIKQSSGLPIVMGGPHSTINAETIIAKACVDYVVIGEGEYALLDLVQAIEKGTSAAGIANVWSKRDGQVARNAPRPLIQDLDALPFPDKEVYWGGYFSDEQIPSADNTYYIVTSRGCPHRCTYCHYDYTNQLYAGIGPPRAVRFRSIPNVIAELKQAVARYPIKTVGFWDDNFTLNRKRLVELIDVYSREIGLPFYCPTHPSLVNEEVVEALSRVKGVRVALGMQSANPRIRKEILRRHDTDEDIRRSVHLFEKYGVHYSVDIIFGLPTESAGDFTALPGFFQEGAASTKVVRFFTLIYFGKMSITTMAKERGLLNGKDLAQIAERGYAVAHVDGELARLRNFFLLHHVLPQRLNRWILKTRAYRLFAGPPRYYEKLRRALVPQPEFVDAYARAPGKTANWFVKAYLILQTVIGQTRRRLARSRVAAALRPLPASLWRPREAARGPASASPADRPLPRTVLDAPLPANLVIDSWDQDLPMTVIPTGDSAPASSGRGKPRMPMPSAGA